MKLSDIKKGIIANLAVRNPHTLEVNSVIEGNSYFGLCIFTGVSLMFGHTIDDIAEYQSDDKENIEFMEKKFIQIMDEFYNTKEPGVTAIGFHTKTSLILNFIKHNYGKTISLAEIIKENIK